MKTLKTIIITAVSLFSFGSIHAQTHKHSNKHNHAEISKKTTYVCPMHAEITSNKQGDCTKCGMKLIKSEGGIKKYACPMHTEITSEKAGTCSKCGMNLTKIKPAHKQEDHSGHKHH